MSQNKKRRRRVDPLRNPSHRDYRLYISRVCKKRRKDQRTRISQNYARVTNAVANLWLERVAFRAKQVCRTSGRVTLTASHIKKAVCLELPPEIAKSAVDRMEDVEIALQRDKGRHKIERLH